MYCSHFGLHRPPFNNTPDPTFYYSTPDHEEALATLQYATQQRKGFVLVTGEIGAGKTLIARAFINALPGPEGSAVCEEVPSPTFTLVQVYERLPAPVWHFDLYRIEQPEEVFELGIEEALAEGISLVEWPQRLGEAFRIASRLDLQITFSTPEGARDIVLLGGPAWQERIGALLADG